MYSKLTLICICFLFSQFAPAADSTSVSQQELQILIDVSGSMKHTDPNNLRIPAVKLLVNLLPNGSKAGIWLFAQKTTALMQTGVVNEQWKRKALARIKKIHSSGLFTNIEEAIQTSAQQWLTSTSQQKRDMILLTDGMVDVAKDIMLSAESRDRVMMEQLPLLQQAGAKIYAIALSENADVELMDKLAYDTNGWSETAQSATQLQKVFFNMFKKAVPQNTVSIQGNMFTIDSSIKEFSVLVFKKQGATETQLIMPNQKIIKNSRPGKNASWVAEQGYDLITVKKPKPGQWKIKGEMDPDNQVMIVTDLKFQLDDIPNHLSTKDSFELNAYFTDKQQLISRNDFLSLIDISIEQTDEQGEGSQWSMTPVSGKAGLFSKKIDAQLSKGKHIIRVLADGKTFQREKTHTIEVVDSPIDVEVNVNELSRTVKITLIPNQNIVDTAMMSIQATVTQAGTQPNTKAMSKVAGKWSLDIEGEKGQSKIISFSIMAKTLEGDSVSPSIKPVIINDDLFKKELPKKEHDSLVEKEISTETGKDKEDAEVEGEEEIEETELEEEPVNWLKTSLIVIGINVFLLLIGFFGFKFLKKSASEKQAKLLDRLT